MRAAVAAAAALVLVLAAAGCAPAEQPEQEASSAAQAQAPVAIDVTLDGQSDELDADRAGFAEALSAYLGNVAEGLTARAVAGPSGGLYVLVAGQWLNCKYLGSPGAWAFTPCDGVPEELVTEHPQAPEPEPPAQPEQTEQEQGAAAAQPVQDGQVQAGSTGLLPLSGAASVTGEAAASQLDEALSGYLPSKGISYQAGTAQVEAYSARQEPGGVGFVVVAGGVRVDVVYANGAYGFKVL